MKIWRFTIVALTISLLSTASFAQNDVELSKQFQQIIKHTVPNADVGLVVANADTGNIIYQHNGYQAFTPASNMKIFTAAATLYSLGPKYHYLTTVSLNPKQLRSHVLAGNVAFTFVGDPSLTITDLQNLVRKLKKYGVNTIRGNVVIDDTRFDRPYYAPGWSVDDTNWYYSAPIMAIILNQNSAHLTLSPSQRVGGMATVAINKSSIKPFLSAKSHVKTVTYQWSMHRCSLLLDVSLKNKVSLSGCWPISTKSRNLKIAVRNPRWLAEQVIRNALRTNKIQLTGKIIFAKASKNYKVIATDKSAPMSSLLTAMMKDSNNVYAEAFLKTLGSVYRNHGTFQEGVNAVESILRAKTDIDFDQTKIFDGSGQSRYDLVSPEQIVRLLYVINHSPKIRNYFIDALPDSGINGTLRGRMKSFDLRGKIAAKTGTMMGVSSLSGFIKTKNKQTLIFSIIVNHVVGKIGVARTFQSRVASVLFGYQA